MFAEEEGLEPTFFRITTDAHGILVLMERSIAPENNKFTLKKSALNGFFLEINVAIFFVFCMERALEASRARLRPTEVAVRPRVCSPQSALASTIAT